MQDHKIASFDKTLNHIYRKSHDGYILIFWYILLVAFLNSKIYDIGFGPLTMTMFINLQNSRSSEASLWPKIFTSKYLLLSDWEWWYQWNVHISCFCFGVWLSVCFVCICIFFLFQFILWIIFLVLRVFVLVTTKKKHNLASNVSDKKKLVTNCD